MNIILDGNFLTRAPARHSGHPSLLLDALFITRAPARHSGRLNLILDSNMLHKDARHGGRGYISGQGEGIVTVAGAPARREIWLIALKTNKIIRSVWSARDGTYFFAHLDPNQEYLVIARDYERQRAPFAWDHRKPATEMTLYEQLALLRERGFIVADHDQTG